MSSIAFRLANLADGLTTDGVISAAKGVMAAAVLFSNVYAPKLALLGLVTGVTVNLIGTILPVGGVSRTSLFSDIYSPKLVDMSRFSAFGLTSNETIVLGASGGTPVTTQSWYIG